jgi:ATP-binding cassette subfamily B protein
LKKYPFYKQLDAMDCGPTSLRMVAKYYGRDQSIVKLRQYCDIQKQGVSMAGISDAAEQIGMNTLGIKISLKELIAKEAPLPCILHWNQNHFIVLFHIKGAASQNPAFIIGDPAQDAILTIDKETFVRCWLGDTEESTALLLETTPAFFKQEEDMEEEKTQLVSWGMLWQYLAHHKRYFFQIFLGLIAVSLFQLLIPFLTQGIVDKGVNMQDLSFVYIALIAQLILLVAKFVVEFSRQGLLLYISTHVNLSLLTDFWKKLMRLPVSYFDSKQTGDIMQRLNDQHRIEQFLTGNSINIIFSLINLLLYSFVMLIYSVPVFFIFVTGSALYLLWVGIFLKQRRKLNYKQFALASKENSATMQLIYGMQEIKMHNAEKHYRWIWERLQRGLFRISFKNLSLSQMQQAGALLINEGKNLLVTGIVATAVIKGELTLGSMLAIQYILGALNSPIQQFTGFIQEFQDAKISLERLNEIHREQDEPQAGSISTGSMTGAASISTDSMNGSTSSMTGAVAEPVEATKKSNTGIEIKNLSFGYSRAEDEKVLKNINLSIPDGKVTAIVGMSGSGKTTLLKILQKFYDDKYKGEIRVGQNMDNPGTELKYIIPAHWRDTIGSVMQEGFIFNQSITENIAVGEEMPDAEKLQYAARMANILPFIESLPLGFGTQIGSEGNGISMGQKQRLLIARAIYKNPKIMFFDEATNSLDANNEKVILENLEAFFKGRTVVVVAHRLSTVKNADKIVVLHQGEIVEEGTHQQLAMKKEHYYELVKNQLELGN